jgi:hypothetical protein
MIWNSLYSSKNKLQTWKKIHQCLEHPQSSYVVSLKAERSGKTWIVVQASMGEACIQASFIGWNLVLESFLGGLVIGFQMFCFGKALRFGRTTFSWLWGYKLTRQLGMLLHPKTEVCKRSRNAFKFSFVKYKVWHYLHALPQWQWNLHSPQPAACMPACPMRG